jgi:NAD(P)-dependent dehydrogenase (short-subunit alcohol dehydrogenase family)
VAATQPSVLVTGATSGLGRGVARELAGRGAEVLLHGRDPARTEAAVGEIRGETGNERVQPYLADLASLDEVRRLAADVERDRDGLGVLVNNAGVATRERRTSEDGHELTFAVNYLAGFLLTALLLPLLRRSAPARIVNVASIGQSPIDFDDVMLERRFDGFRAYAQSKLAQVMFTIDLAERLRAAGEGGVTVNALHPATLMDTQMVRETFGSPRTSVEEGVDATVRLVLDPGLAGVSGRYYDGLAESAAHRQAYDPDARRRLWELSEELTGTEFRV